MGVLNFKDHFEKKNLYAKKFKHFYFIKVAFFKVFFSYKELPPFLMQIEKKLVLRRLNPHKKWSYSSKWNTPFILQLLFLIENFL